MDRLSWPARTVAAAVVMVLVVGCSAQNGRDHDDQTLVLGTAVDLNSFAPADSRDAHYVQYYQPVYDSLIRIAPDGSYEPQLATAWDYDETGTVLTLHLRDDVTFSDGEDFDAAAVRANLEATRDGTGTSSAAFKAIDDMVVVSETTIELHLSGPDPGLVHQLGLPGGMMASPAVLGTPELASVPVGSGPYVLDTTSTTRTVQYSYVRNEEYWDSESYPYDRIILRPITDQTARLNALRSGQIDGGMGSALNAPTAREWGLQVTESPGPGYQGLFLLDRDGAIAPPLADVRVRQAINHAIDRDAVVQLMADGAGTSTAQVFNPNSAGWTDDLADAYPYDPERARTLLAEAGYADGIDLEIPEPTYENLSPFLAQQLAEVGIRTSWVQIPRQTVNDEYLSGKYPVIWQQLQSSEPWQGINFWGSPSAPWNPLASADPEIDAAIGAIRHADDDERPAAFQELARLYAEKAWFVPVYFPDAVYFSAPSVEVTPQALQIVPSIANYAPAG